MQLEKGLVQVYTGNGKGKTTAALGLAFRAVGRGMQVCMIQFIKGRVPCGEQLAAGRLGTFFTLVQTGREGWVRKGEPSPEDRKLASEAISMARETLYSGRYDLVILDEINNAVHYGLISVEEVLSLINGKPERVELVLTGRNAHEKIIEAADLVTEMREIKHYYKKGIPARTGIEK